MIGGALSGSALVRSPAPMRAEWKESLAPWNGLSRDGDVVGRPCHEWVARLYLIAMEHSIQHRHDDEGQERGRKQSAHHGPRQRHIRFAPFADANRHRQ